jgi:predicted nucleic acid-binding protein
VKPLVFNSTPLIYIAKAGLSGIFEGLHEEKLTSPHVKIEVVDEGRHRGVPDAIILEGLFLNGVFKVVEPKDEGLLESLSRTRGLHVADAEVLAIAKELGGMAIVDDEVARKTAKIYGISHAGTPYILMRAVLQGLIAKDGAKRALKEMVSSGWRCSIETYAGIMETMERL